MLGQTIDTLSKGFRHQFASDVGVRQQDLPAADIAPRTGGRQRREQGFSPVLVGYHVHLLVGVSQRENRLGEGAIRQILIDPLAHVLYGIGEEFQLIHQVGKFRRIDLRKLHLPKRQMADDLIDHTRSNQGGAMINIFNKLSHGAKTSKHAKGK